MSDRFGIVDLFSGPGGLGEGFSAFSDSTGHQPFKIEVSIEKENSAHETLRLRSFLRQFPEGFPNEYYSFINGRVDEPDWTTLYPAQWSAAKQEAVRLELGDGNSETSRYLNKRISQIRKKYSERTVLIGGPPCQAYSLAGRSRNAGNKNYVPDKDERNFLYQQYVEVLRRLKPYVFVMENVKGMLSSAVKGDGIFRRVMQDLKNAAGRDSYQLIAIAPRSTQSMLYADPLPSDFVVRAEDHGVPQARHRVIIVGVRTDILDSDWNPNTRLLAEAKRTVSVSGVIDDLPRLRSGLSRDDSHEKWREALQTARRIAERYAIGLEENEKDMFTAALAGCGTREAIHEELGRKSDRARSRMIGSSSCLRSWLTDSRVRNVPNHETRGHMPADLARYFFAATYASAFGISPKARDFPLELTPNHKNWRSGMFDDRFRVQVANNPAKTITSHISKDGHYYIHPDASQCRSLTVREAARIQTFPDNYFFKGNRTEQYVQVGNAVPPYLALQIAECVSSYVLKE